MIIQEEVDDSFDLSIYNTNASSDFISTYNPN